MDRAHSGARERAFDELFRRPAQPHQHRLPSHQGQQSQQGQGQYRYPTQAQQQQYHPQHAYPDYPQQPPQRPPPPQAAADPYGQFGMAGAGATGMGARGYSGQRNASVSSYRSSGGGGTNDAGQRASYFDQTYPGGSGAGAYAAASKQQQHQAYAQQQQQQQRSYSSAQSYADYGAYPQQGYYPSSSDAASIHSISNSNSNSHSDPSPPPPPPGAGLSHYTSPRVPQSSQYAPTMSSGPASASTSTSLFSSRPSTSSVSSLPYSFGETSMTSNGTSTSSSSTSGVSPAASFAPTPNMSPAHAQLPLPGAAAGSSSYSTAPPRLPDILPSSSTGGVGMSDDFFGNWQSQQDVAGYADGSWRSSMIGGGGGGGGMATPTATSSLGLTGTGAGAGSFSKRGSPASAAEVEGYSEVGYPSADPYPTSSSGIYSTPSSAFDRSRRSSADSDRSRSFVYPSQQLSQTSTLVPINPSLVSLSSTLGGSVGGQGQSQYPYGNGTPLASQSATALALQTRKSSESMRVGSLGSKGSGMYGADRALSFSSAERPEMFSAGGPYSSAASAFAASQPHLPSTPRPPSHGSLPPNFHVSPPSTTHSSPHHAHPHLHAPPRQKSPVVYPALLSRVASAFRDRVLLAERIKDGLVYQDAFDGRDAVDKIAYIIKTSDRNLALLLGRALDAQKFFHDVTYDHRLRDSPNEVYQFRERISTASLPFLQDASPPLVPPVDQQGHATAVSPHAPGSAAARAQTAGQQQSQQRDSRRASVPSSAAAGVDIVPTAEEDELPSGVFTLLTDCYSPTCTRDRLCYSIACPRRLEQQARLNLKREGLNSGLEKVGVRGVGGEGEGGEGGLRRRDSVESVGDLREPGSLWIHSVPQEVIDSTSDSEKKRQEALNEVFYTERDFVRDMEYLRDFWIKPLRSSNIIPESRREDFVTQVFWNVLEIYAVNVRLCEMLNKRQKQAHVVDHIGDIFLDMVPHFAPFVKYGAHQLYGKYEFEKEKGSNPAFAKFVDETERLPESRKLELNGYLTKPTTRLARYPLLLSACLKHTADDNPDKVAIPKVIKLVREFLDKVNVETGKSENRFNLAQLDQQLVFKNGEAVDLRLRDEERELIFKGPLKKRGGTQSESAELQVFLFDHAVLMVKQKSKNEQYKVYRKPIPLELLVVAPVDDAASIRNGVVRPRSLMARGASSAKILPATAAQPPPGVDKNNKQGFALTFIHLGRRGYQITLWANTWTARKKWLEKIEERQNELRERSLVFETLPLSAGYFVGTNRLTCAAPFDNGNRMVYGTENGVYLADLREKNKVPVKVISVPSVTQLDVLEEQGILIVLADKAVQTFFVDHLDPGDAVGAAKRARKISASATFFKAGQCLGRTLVCVVKSGNVSSTIKTLEPIDQPRGGKKQPTIRKFLQGSNESLRVFKEFYIPTESSSVHFLKSKLCVGCTKGFEIVDLETLDTQGLLDPADSSLDFVQKRENAKPIAIYRIDGEFLLCYDEFAFYVNKNGWRAKSNWIIQWEGFPTAFALHYPYVLAFEPTFIEVRHVESGALMQIIPGNNIRCLFADSPPSSSASSASYYGHSGYHPNSPAARYGSPYGGGRMPQPPARSAIVVSDGDRAFSLVFNAPTDL
ncbi:hypothetical protein JCM11251_001126 [Rhodosporidiobolus azoricus]